MNESNTESPSDIVSYLLKNDPFSQWMGVKILEADLGHCKIECRIRDEMLNGFDVTHGGIIFSLADTALAFSAATYGRVSLAIDNSISITKKSFSGSILTAESNKVSLTHKTGVFDVRLRNVQNEPVAFMKGTVYRTGEEIVIDR